ncbi:DUF362 domain-containing protein [Acetobacterium woodii]|uniref:Ferredoxin n=1 Tax=Acetobacterium woodii (strain ATCC 29683 / DSM 1030 / JCM 2381 / KCTC 1655 / WB1) TaxID=931626 RepID=H6LF76_ACEWD|nr:DUF362 domain-containing protein [Acetobacterium woodii]AFA48176.1 hypothetical protein containing a ferredoxin domain [Acetobacterium woodii DSM 1030]
MNDKSKVYFTTLRTTGSNNILKKLEKLVVAAGMTAIDFENKFAAIKIHLGEPGNLAYLRPNYAKVVVDMIKANGGKPFLTDCNTLYVGRRKNALEHLDAAYENGYNPFVTGCHVIIGDGLKGTDDIEVPLDGGECIKTAKIGRAMMDADIFISMTHFKGHESTGFGGVLKNIGMGCGSRRGKMEMHSSSKPFVKENKCRSCKICEKSCAFNAISYRQGDGKAAIDDAVCVGCGRCMGVCPFDAISPKYDESNDVLNKKIAEYTKAVVSGRPQFHISFVIDVSPNCDCHVENDLPIIQDVGIFASIDPIALDIACADACNQAPIISGSYVDDQIHEHHVEDPENKDLFTLTHPETNWQVAIDHGVKLGLGNKEYVIIEV